MEPQFSEPMKISTQNKEDDDGAVSMEVDIQVLLWGSLIFLGVVFILGLIVNLSAAVIYCRSRLIRGFTDKFIFFVLVVDLLSLLIFIPTSFLFVLEYSASVGNGATGEATEAEKRSPLFLNDHKVFVRKNDGGDSSVNSEEDDGDFSSYCVQQWIFLIHNLIINLAANLSVLGALKIAVERYLAVMAPLHYHKMLKSSVIFFVSLLSFILSLASAVITAVDPADFSGSFLLGGQCSFKFFDQSPTPWSSSLAKKQISTISMRLDTEEVDIDSGSLSGLTEELDHSSKLALPKPAVPYPYQSDSIDTVSSSVAFWWWPVLKLAHASVFYLIPLGIMLFMYSRIRTAARKQNHRMSCHSKSSFIVPPDVTAASVDVKQPVGCSVVAVQQVFGKFKLVQRIKRKARMDRAARVAVHTIGLLVVCFGPLFFVQIFSGISSLTNCEVPTNPWATGRLSSKASEGSQFAKFLLPTLLACLHPLLSPLVYVYRYKKVKDELKALLKQLISKCCLCCCCNRDSHSTSSTASPDCQEIVKQFNYLAQQKIPPSPPSQMLESQNAPATQCDDGSNNITNKPANADSNDDHYHFYPSSQHPQHLLEQDSKDLMCEDDEDYNGDLVGRQEYSADAEFSDVENQREHAISMMRPNNNGGFFNIFNSWMSSYSRRWNQHRESVTSTASFITLLSNRSRSIPSSAVDII